MRSQVLQQLALTVRQWADLGGKENAFGGNTNEFINDQSMTQILNSSYETIYDLLKNKFPENYYWGTAGQTNSTFVGYLLPVVQGKYVYNLPFDFLNIKGLDLALDNTLQNWASVRPFTLKERNLFSFPLFTTLAYAGWQNMRWQIQGNQIQILPQVGPLPGNMKMSYCPCCPTLCPALPVAHATSTAYAQNALVYVSVATNGEPAVNQVYVSLNAGTSSSSAPAFVVPGYGQQNGIITDNNIQWAYQGPIYSFTTSLDGISGWEKLVLLDASINAGIQEETDVTALMSARQEMLERVNVAAENRNSGDPMVISGGFGLSEGGPAYGNNGGPWGGGGGF